MVLQMPVFVALFNILYMTIDLRQAPFMLWVTDLSLQDPYYVLPVIMGATMFIQQKITPTTMDPAQAKIMLMLPDRFNIPVRKFSCGPRPVLADEQCLDHHSTISDGSFSVARQSPRLDGWRRAAARAHRRFAVMLTK